MRASFLALALVVSACSSSESSPAARSSGTPTTSPSAGPSSASASPSATETPPPSPSASATRKQRPGTRIQVHGSAFGRILFDAGGQAIYVFDQESRSRPRCYGSCAAAWPPVLTRGTPVGLRGVDQSLLGTTRRRDGSTQVTYAGHPLYFYAHEGSYEVKCHDVFENGGRWYAVQADGTRAP